MKTGRLVWSIGLLICFLFTGTSAADLEEVLALHLDALGGAKALSSVKTTYTSSTVKISGMEGSADTWSAFPDRFRQEVDLGIMRQVMGLT